LEVEQAEQLATLHSMGTIGVFGTVGPQEIDFQTFPGGSEDEFHHLAS